MAKHTSWWETGVIYQIYPRSFKDTTGNGVGDLSGVLEKLDYLSHTLGVDAIWLSPFYPSPMADFGYDVSDYTDVHPLFGTLEEFDALAAGCHQRGLKVIIDFVPNHSSEEHPWFKESRSSRDNPKRDWYVWRDAKPDGSRPNNWLSIFGGPAWEWDAHTQQYYLHTFLKEQPDLNWRNPAVKAAMFSAIEFWLRRGVDGFRIDVAHYIMKDPEERDNPPNPSRATLLHKDNPEYDTQLHLYDHGHPDIHQVFRELRDVLDAYSSRQPRFAIGEIHEFELDAWAAYYGERLDELHMPFNFLTLAAEWSAAGIRDVVENIESVVPAGAWPNYVFSNHDEPRLATRYGAHSARLAAMLLLTLRGTPTMYYGDEVGMEDVSIPPDQQQDPWGRRMPGLGRDGCRTPMQWEASPGAGFTMSASPWLPFHENFGTHNVETQRADPGSLFTLYRKLLALRKGSAALHRGAYETIAGTPEACLAFQRTAEDEVKWVALNFSDDVQQVGLPAQGRVVLSTHEKRPFDLTASVTLHPWEGVIVARELVP